MDQTIMNIFYALVWLSPSVFTAFLLGPGLGSYLLIRYLRKHGSPRGLGKLVIFSRYALFSAILGYGLFFYSSMGLSSAFLYHYIETTNGIYHQPPNRPLSQEALDRDQAERKNKEKAFFLGYSNEKAMIILELALQMIIDPAWENPCYTSNRAACEFIYLHQDYSPPSIWTNIQSLVNSFFIFAAINSSLTTITGLITTRRIRRAPQVT